MALPWLPLAMWGSSATPPGCVPDAHKLFWRSDFGCSSVDWAERIAGALPRTSPVTLVNVGANKGYKVPEFLGLWSQRRVENHTLGWRNHLLAYAKQQKSNSLRRFACGNCNDCHAKRPPPHTRAGARVHLLEIAPANQRLLRYVLDAERLDDIVTLHKLGASNVSQRVPIVKTIPPGEERQGVLVGFKARRFERANATLHVDAVALDDLFRTEGLDHVYQVSIDTEGFDALVLEGMRGTIARKQVSVIEFEVDQMGFWTRDLAPNPNHNPSPSPSPNPNPNPNPNAGQPDGLLDAVAPGEAHRSTHLRTPHQCRLRLLLVGRQGAAPRNGRLLRPDL